MSGPPPPPRRRKPNPLVSVKDDIVSRSTTKKQQSSTSPIKNLNKEKSEDILDNESLKSSNSLKKLELPASIIAYNEFNNTLNDSIDPDQIPETVIGHGVDVRGNMQFERLLRVEGKFQGTIISQGDLAVGRNGCVIANIANLQTVTVLGGKITGNINAEKVILRKGSIVTGNIVCKGFLCEKYVTINGYCNIHILSPEVIDSNGDIIIPVPEIEVGMPHVQHDKKKNKKNSKSHHELDQNENVANIEEQKNKLKADKQSRKEQMTKLEANPAISPRMTIRRESAKLPLPFLISQPNDNNNLESEVSNIEPSINNGVTTVGPDSNVKSSINDNLIETGGSDSNVESSINDNLIETGGSDSNVESSIHDNLIETGGPDSNVEPSINDNLIETGGSDSNLEPSISNDPIETNRNNIESNEAHLSKNTSSDNIET